MRILNREQMKTAETKADQNGTSYRQLMENAGTAAAGNILAWWEQKEQFHLPKSALLLCGKGNNAGDAFVIARILAAHNWSTSVALLCGQDFTPLARLNYDRLPQSTVVLTGPPPADGFSLVVDGVFGTGFKGALPDAVQAIFAAANAANAKRVALDIPSGLDCDTGFVSPGTFSAHRTLTFGAYKPGLLADGAKAYCGEIFCLDIGL